MEIYLDNSATTQSAPEVVEAMREIWEQHYGNPSALHRKGLEAEKLLKKARSQVAGAIGAADSEIIFTSGGTESNNLAIFGALKKLRQRGNHLLTSKIEHPSVRNVFNQLEQDGYQVTYLNVDSSGRIDPNELQAALEQKPVLVSIMLVNNETGSIQPISNIGTMLHNIQPKPVFHVDAVQAFGKVPFRVKDLNADLLSVSSHKFHGPKGVGALYVRKGIPLSPILFGGGQENGLRSGTENVPGIVGMGVAATLAGSQLTENTSKLLRFKRQFLNCFESGMEPFRINSPDEPHFAPHILNVSFPGVKAEVLLHALEQDGIYVATGSACGSKKKTMNHVHQALGFSQAESEGTIRLSFSIYNTEAEINYAGEKLQKHVVDLRRVISSR
jgi:cysteine desulfurase